MALQDEVIKVLRSGEVQRINFAIENIRVYPSGFLTVARAIRAGNIVIASYGGDPLGRQPRTPSNTPLAFPRIPQSLQAHPDNPGEYFSRGQSAESLRSALFLPFPHLFLRWHNALVVHEAVHALSDYNRLKVGQVNDEVAAYVAQMMYYIRCNEPMPFQPGLTLNRQMLFGSAYAIASMLVNRQQPTTLLIQQLKLAILNEPFYANAHRIYSYDGIPTCRGSVCTLPPPGVHHVR